MCYVHTYIYMDKRRRIASLDLMDTQSRLSRLTASYCEASKLLVFDIYGFIYIMVSTCTYIPRGYCIDFDVSLLWLS
jgi:hypothetical protein